MICQVLVVLGGYRSIPWCGLILLTYPLIESIGVERGLLLLEVVRGFLGWRSLHGAGMDVFVMRLRHLVLGSD